MPDQPEISGADKSAFITSSRQPDGTFAALRLESTPKPCIINGEFACPQTCDLYGVRRGKNGVDFTSGPYPASAENLLEHCEIVRRTPPQRN